MMARGRKSSGERFSKCRRLNFGPLTRLVVLGADDREGKDISKPALHEQPPAVVAARMPFTSLRNWPTELRRSFAKSILHCYDWQCRTSICSGQSLQWEPLQMSQTGWR